MREIHSVIDLAKTFDYAPYTLAAEELIYCHGSLAAYLDHAASRPQPRNITFKIPRHYGAWERFCSDFESQSDKKSSAIFAKDRPTLLKNGRLRRWSLTVVEIEPAGLKLHFVSHARWNAHRKAIEAFRQANPGQSAVPPAEITANLDPYCETLIFHAPNMVLACGTATLFEFEVPRIDNTGHDLYTVCFKAHETMIAEPAGFAHHTLIIDRTADPQNYTAKIIEVQ